MEQDPTETNPERVTSSAATSTPQIIKGDISVNNGEGSNNKKRRIDNTNNNKPEDNNNAKPRKKDLSAAKGVSKAHSQKKNTRRFSDSDEDGFESDTGRGHGNSDNSDSESIHEDGRSKKQSTDPKHAPLQHRKKGEELADDHLTEDFSKGAASKRDRDQNYSEPSVHERLDLLQKIIERSSRGQDNYDRRDRHSDLTSRRDRSRDNSLDRRRDRDTHDERKRSSRTPRRDRSRDNSPDRRRDRDTRDRRDSRSVKRERTSRRERSRDNHKERRVRGSYERSRRHSRSHDSDSYYSESSDSHSRDYSDTDSDASDDDHDINFKDLGFLYEPKKWYRITTEAHITSFNAAIASHLESSGKDYRRSEALYIQRMLELHIRHGIRCPESYKSPFWVDAARETIIRLMSIIAARTGASYHYVSHLEGNGYVGKTPGWASRKVKAASEAAKKDKKDSFRGDSYSNKYRHKKKSFPYRKHNSRGSNGGASGGPNKTA